MKAGGEPGCVGCCSDPATEASEEMVDVDVFEAAGRALVASVPTEDEQPE